jgi:hypothetical protein
VIILKLPQEIKKKTIEILLKNKFCWRTWLGRLIITGAESWEWMEKY